MVCQCRRERVFVVEPRDRRVLWTCRRFGGDRYRQRRGGGESGELAPPEEIEGILIAPVMVDARHVHVGVARQRVRNRLWQTVVISGLRVSRLRELRQIGRSNRTDASCRDLVSGELLSRCYAGSGACSRNLAGNVDGNLHDVPGLRILLRPICEVTSPFSDRWNRERRAIRAASLVIGLPVEIEK